MQLQLSPPNFTLQFHLAFFLALFYSLCSAHSCHPNDLASLLDFKGALVWPNPILSWKTSTDCCQWHGVYCDQEGRVTHLQLPSMKLQGHISPSISNLTSLTTLDLSNNILVGSIPQDIGDLAYLESLDLSGNQLSNAIPSSLMQCTHLFEIDLSSNYLSGDISSLNFSSLTRLNYLYLSHNHLFGAPLFESLARLTHLSSVDLSYNNLSGPLSSLRCSSLPLLSSLDLSYNSFNGEFPNSLYSCRSLTEVQLNNNHLRGVQNLPSIGSIASSLSILSLRNNNLSNITGTLQSVMQCNGLKVLDLANNLLVDNIQETDRLFTLPEAHYNLRAISLRGCALSRIPIWLANFTNLQMIDLSFNNITSPIPSWLGTLPHLSAIDLSSNLISGQIPVALCDLPALNSDSSLDYHDNWIPARWLHSLNLSNNKLDGNIPEQIRNLRSLKKLDLSYNNLSGRIPDSLNELPVLTEFNVSYNHLEVPIPEGDGLEAFSSSSYLGNLRIREAPLYQIHPHEVASKAVTDQEDDKGLEMPWFWICVGFGYLTGFLGVCYSLLFSTTWRNTYFNLLIHLKDQVHVYVAIRVARFRRFKQG